MALFTGWPAQAFEEPKGLLDHFLSRIRSELKRLPDYVCTQTVERFSRSTAEQSWSKVDTLRFDVARRGSRRGLVGILLFGNMLAIGFLAMLMSGRASEMAVTVWKVVRGLIGGG